MNVGSNLQITYYCESQLKLAATVMEENSSWHLDSTGSVVSKWKNKQIYCYALVLKTSFKGEHAVPLLEWLTNCHDTKSICKALYTWWIDSKEIIKTPEIVVIDFSWAFLHALSHVFNNNNLDEQLEAQWQIMTGQINKKITVVRLCVSHYIKAVVRSMSKKRVPKLVSYN